MHLENNKSKKMESLLNKFNNNYFEYNPIGEMIDDLEKIGIKAKTEFPVQHLDYEKSAKIKIVIEDSNDMLVNLYRMNSGRYEVNAYEIQLARNLKKENKQKKSPF